MPFEGDMLSLVAELHLKLAPHVPLKTQLLRILSYLYKFLISSSMRRFASACRKAFSSSGAIEGIYRETLACLHLAILKLWPPALQSWPFSEGRKPRFRRRQLIRIDLSLCRFTRFLNFGGHLLRLDNSPPCLRSCIPTTSPSRAISMCTKTRRALLQSVRVLCSRSLRCWQQKSLMSGRMCFTPIFTITIGRPFTCLCVQESRLRHHVVRSPTCYTGELDFSLVPTFTPRFSPLCQLALRAVILCLSAGTEHRCLLVP